MDKFPDLFELKSLGYKKRDKRTDKGIEIKYL